MEENDYDTAMMLFNQVDPVNTVGSGVASPKKVGGPNHISLLVSSKSSNTNIHAWDTPLYIYKLFNGFALISGGV